MNNNFREYYQKQVELLLHTLPYVAKESCFAVKGGSAINLFIRDMPRFSIDIDLTYVPIESRQESLSKIEKALLNIKYNLLHGINGVHIVEKRTRQDNRLNKLFVTLDNTQIKIEPNEILRGTVFPCESRNLVKKAEQMFNLSVSNVSIVSIADLYAGKICAALDRQHPRDLFDMHLLLKSEGLTDQIRQAFIVYLASNTRPMYELLNPNFIDIKTSFNEEFVNMPNIPISYKEILDTRKQLVKLLRSSLTNQERKFLFSIKLGEPEWSLMNISHLSQLPSLQWKILNIKKMNKNKHQTALDKLKAVLEL